MIHETDIKKEERSFALYKMYLVIKCYGLLFSLKVFF